MRRALIINADDLGYTAGVNRAVTECARQGSLCSTTLMANGEAFADAAARVKGEEHLGVGVHLVLTELHALCPPEEIPGLADPHGRLPATPYALLLALRSGKVGREALRRELDRQIGRILDHGITPTHLDSHKHIHVLPEVLDVVVELASRYGIRWVRSPFDATSAREILPCLERGARLTFYRQHLASRLLRAYRPHFLRRLRRSGLHTPDHFFGISLTGIWNETTLRRLVDTMPPGLNEWMVHPGECDSTLRRQRTRLLEQREAERALLACPLLSDLLGARRIPAVSYGKETL